MLKNAVRRLLPPAARSIPRNYFPWHPYFLDLGSLRDELNANGERRPVPAARAATPIDQTDPLQALAEQFKPTKRILDYIKHYSFHFSPIRESVRKVVEIGVQTPASLHMWETYFPNAVIYGVDIDPACRAFEGGRRRVLIGDQNDRAFLSQVVRETGGDIDIVIDDGEHSEPAILTSLVSLFPALSSHGIYVVEDIQNLPRVSNFFRELEKSVNFWSDERHESEWSKHSDLGHGASWLDRNVVGLHFYRYICFVNRGFNPEDNPYLNK